MERAEALRILGATAGSSEDDLGEAYIDKKLELDRRIAAAPTAKLKAKYSTQLEQLDVALRTLNVGSGEGLSATQIRDLPSLEAPVAPPPPVAMPSVAAPKRPAVGASSDSGAESHRSSRLPTSSSVSVQPRVEGLFVISRKPVVSQSVELSPKVGSSTSLGTVAEPLPVTPAEESVRIELSSNGATTRSNAQAPREVGMLTWIVAWLRGERVATGDVWGSIRSHTATLAAFLRSILVSLLAWAEGFGGAALVAGGCSWIVIGLGWFQIFPIVAGIGMLLCGILVCKTGLALSTNTLWARRVTCLYLVILNIVFALTALGNSMQSDRPETVLFILVVAVVCAGMGFAVGVND